MESAVERRPLSQYRLLLNAASSSVTASVPYEPMAVYMQDEVMAAVVSLAVECLLSLSSSLPSQSSAPVV